MAQPKEVAMNTNTVIPAWSPANANPGGGNSNLDWDWTNCPSEDSYGI